MHSIVPASGFFIAQPSIEVTRLARPYCWLHAGVFQAFTVQVTWGPNNDNKTLYYFGDSSNSHNYIVQRTPNSYYCNCNYEGPYRKHLNHIGIPNPVSAANRNAREPNSDTKITLNSTRRTCIESSNRGIKQHHHGLQKKNLTETCKLRHSVYLPSFLQVKGGLRLRA